eukprot:2204291-Rhodomonas_salina.3
MSHLVPAELAVVLGLVLIHEVVGCPPVYLKLPFTHRERAQAISELWVLLVLVVAEVVPAAPS